jgi:hypothetical protein
MIKTMADEMCGTCSTHGNHQKMHTGLKGGKFQNGILKKKQNVGRKLDSSGSEIGDSSEILLIW